MGVYIFGMKLWLITNKNRGIIQNPVDIFRKQFKYQYLNSMTPFILSLVIFLLVIDSKY